jgi:hypothetical protein
MRITKKAIAGIAALALAGGGGVLMMTSADAATTTSTTAGVVPGDNTVTSRTVKDGSLYQSDFNQDVINKVFRVPGFQSVSAWSVKPGSITEATLSKDVVTKLNAVGGAPGKDGTNGIDGKDGVNGKDGVSGLAIDDQPKVIPTGFSEITLDCAEGKKAIGGGVKFDSGTSASAKDLVVNGSYPKLVDVDGVSTSTGWTIAVTNTSNAHVEITVQTFVTCVMA